MPIAVRLICSHSETPVDLIIGIPNWSSTGLIAFAPVKTVRRRIPLLRIIVSSMKLSAFSSSSSMMASSLSLPMTFSY